MAKLPSNFEISITIEVDIDTFLMFYYGLLGSLSEDLCRWEDDGGPAYDPR